MRIRFALPLCGALFLLVLAFPGIAVAHEQRDVGQHHFGVGFLNEPAIQNQMNGIDLTVTTIADKKPVEGAEKSLKAEVIVGGNAKSMPLTLRARFGQPGKYAADFMPTASGSYIFHLSGTINGENVDQRFESGPGRFDNVQPLQALEFPVKLADPATLQDQLSEAQAAAGQARALAIAGLAAGLAGLILAARRRSASVRASERELGHGRT